MGERFKPAVLKTVRPVRVSGVRIPPPPPPFPIRKGCPEPGSSAKGSPIFRSGKAIQSRVHRRRAARFSNQERVSRAGFIGEGLFLTKPVPPLHVGVIKSPLFSILYGVPNSAFFPYAPRMDLTPTALSPAGNSPSSFPHGPLSTSHQLPITSHHIRNSFKLHSYVTLPGVGGVPARVRNGRIPGNSDPEDAGQHEPFQPAPPGNPPRASDSAASCALSTTHATCD